MTSPSEPRSPGTEAGEIRWHLHNNCPHNGEREAAGPLLAVAGALEQVLSEFDYWASDPKPAIDGGTVRIYRFREVQPAMERRINEARAALDRLALARNDAGEPG